MTKQWAKLVLLGGALLMAACSEDEYHYPDLLTELVDADTDSQQQVYQFHTDEGTTYTLSKPLAFDESTPDSTYRMRCRYTVDGKETTVYSLKQILAVHPVAPTYFKDSLLSDPVKVTSIWRSGKYLNLNLGVMTRNDEKHAMHFVKFAKEATANGKQRQVLQFYHNQNNDPEAFTRETFVSCHLEKLDLQSGDSLYLDIHTYDGWKRYGFEY